MMALSRKPWGLDVSIASISLSISSGVRNVTCLCFTFGSSTRFGLKGLDTALGAVSQEATQGDQMIALSHL